MINFHQIASGVDVLPLSHALITNAALWNADPRRKTFKGSAHGAVDDILIRFSDKTEFSDVMDSLDSSWQSAANYLPQVRPLIFDLARRLEAVEIGRVVITRLRAGERIDRHRDMGAYADAHHRYHIVLQGLPGSQFNCGDESVCMRTGEVWWFNAQEEHEVINNSQDDRIHLLVDLKK